MRYLLLLLPLFVASCAGYDRLSHRNAEEAADTIEKYVDPSLPDDVKQTLKDQADAWVEYEKAKQ